MTRPATQASQPFHGLRPDNCRPVEGLPPAQAQVLGAAGREPVPKARRPRRPVDLTRQLLPTTTQLPRCGAGDTA
jgi:hypothetical protein